ncbi:hypothetical protein TrispH2_009675 [Trichoplax sp. H2]|nr:hypothetical protein TrispH2_009675 [Trichoplax sp. H2]|eukprot:RDD38486.1 hypothetical protein TrispH2_009675 [Trichoplax sp. H2]
MVLNSKYENINGQYADMISPPMVKSHEANSIRRFPYNSTVSTAILRSPVLRRNSDSQSVEMYYRRLIIGFQTGTYAIRYQYVNSTFITLDFGVLVPSSRESWSKVGVPPNQFYPTEDFTMEIVYELRGSSTPSSGGILIDDIEVTNSKEVNSGTNKAFGLFHAATVVGIAILSTLLTLSPSSLLF